jgi:hypothetical protein
MHSIMNVHIMQSKGEKKLKNMFFWGIKLKSTSKIQNSLQILLKPPLSRFFLIKAPEKHKNIFKNTKKKSQTWRNFF